MDRAHDSLGGRVALHADLLRPEAVGDAKTPVILMIGPYFGHSGQLGAVGAAPLVGGEPYDPVGPSEGPSARFHDLINGAKLIERGYSVLMVDLRGFGGSTGCLDWAGPGEQADVVAAVEWAASQEWSTGKVGMYGKSYDAVTGLAGAARTSRGPRAVVAQEPVYDMYRYLYGEASAARSRSSRRRSTRRSSATPATGPGRPVLHGVRRERHAATWLQAAQLRGAGGNSDHFSPVLARAQLHQRSRRAPTSRSSSLRACPRTTPSPTAWRHTSRRTTRYERAWSGPWDHVRGAEMSTGATRG